MTLIINHVIYLASKISLSKAYSETPTDSNGETCKFLDPPPTTDTGIWDDCHSAYTQSSSSFSITRNGAEQMKVVSQVSMNPHSVLCFNTKQDMPNGYTVNEGFKIKLKELKEEFSVDRKAARGAKIHITENGPKCTDDAENEIKNIKRDPKMFCSTDNDVKLIKFWVLPGNKQYSFFDAKEMRKISQCSTKFCIFWKCVWNEDNVQLIEFGSDISEIAVFEVQRISPDGKVVSSYDIAQITGTLNEQLANSSPEDVKISLVHKSDFVNPMVKKFVVMKNGKLLVPVGSNRIDTVNTFEKFFLEIKGELETQVSYSFADYNTEYSVSDWTTLPDYEVPKKYFEEFRIERSSFSTTRFFGINPRARITTVLESSVKVDTFYENYGLINDFECMQITNSAIECIIVDVSSPGSVALYLYEPLSCTPLDKAEGFTLIGLKMRLNMHVLTQRNAKVQFHVCTPVGLCRAVIGIRRDFLFKPESYVQNIENVLISNNTEIDAYGNPFYFINEIGSFTDSCLNSIKSPFESVGNILKSLLLVFLFLVFVVVLWKVMSLVKGSKKSKKIKYFA
ncbi:hypothetical protein ROZALSC1DRAFT_24419 [Rozella allomycis CSF55]|uniref:Uncharacterized protein n=1 Tax=Rozella allomycis (strain CSF55) TaxID=988480 RepID=A0A4P9YF59_ROZAC|nr:hypothetical protein ROZALSC1DRAFT_24419 [Rozella allomycis CSF55]